MLTQILSAQSDIGVALADLSRAGDASLIAQALAQQQTLAKLERALSSGSAATIAPNIRGEIAAVVTASANLSQQAQQAADQRAGIDLATAQARTRATVQEIGRDIYERRIFDPYLRFASAEDEEAYRRREEENRRAIEEALAEQTPEGDLRAARLIQRQLADAGAHGADASPEFAGRMARINNDISGLERAAASQRQTPPEGQNLSAAPESPPPAPDDQLASVLATFRAAGVAGGVPAQQSAHGLSVDGSSPGRSQTALT